MITHEYVEVITPVPVSITYKRQLDTYVIEFDDVTVVCSTYMHKGRKVVLIKSVTDENGDRYFDNSDCEYMDYIHEIGACCFDILGTPFFEWGDLYRLVRFMKGEYEEKGIGLLVVNGKKVLQHPLKGEFFVQDVAGNYLELSRSEIQARIDQYKRLGIPLSIPEWVLVNVPKTNKPYNYIPFRELLGNDGIIHDKNYREIAKSYLDPNPN